MCTKLWRCALLCPVHACDSPGVLFLSHLLLSSLRRETLSLPYMVTPVYFPVWLTAFPRFPQLLSTTVGRPSQAGRRLLPSLVWSSDSHYALRDVDRAGRVKAESAEKKQGEEGGEQQQPAAGGPSVLDAAARAAARAADSRITRFVHVRALQFCGFCASPHVRTPPPPL